MIIQTHGLFAQNWIVKGNGDWKVGQGHGIQKECLKI